MMNTQYSRMYNVPFSFDDVLKLVRSLSVEDKVKLEKELEKETLLYRSKQLSKKIKPNSIKLEDIVEEVTSYRSEKDEG